MESYEVDIKHEKEQNQKKSVREDEGERGVGENYKKKQEKEKKCRTDERT